MKFFVVSGARVVYRRMSISPAVVSRIATVSPSAGVVCIVVFGIGVSVTLSRHPVRIKVLARVNKRRVLNFFIGLGLRECEGV